MTRDGGRWREMAREGERRREKAREGERRRRTGGGVSEEMGAHLELCGECLECRVVVDDTIARPTPLRAHAAVGKVVAVDRVHLAPRAVGDRVLRHAQVDTPRVGAVVWREVIE